MAGYSHFMRLPVELRLQIYAHAFYHFELADGPRGLTLHGNIKSSAHMLCRVNKRVRAEAIIALAEQTKVLIVDTTHLVAPCGAPYIACYKPKLKDEWFMNIEVLAFGCAIKLLPGLTRFPNLKAVVELETVIWGVLQCALPIKSTILRLTKSDYLSGPRNRVRPLFLEPNRSFRIWARIVFAGLNEVTSDFERFTELLARRELLASPLWFEVRPASVVYSMATNNDRRYGHALIKTAYLQSRTTQSLPEVMICLALSTSLTIAMRSAFRNEELR